METKDCPRCGTENPADAVKCNYCDETFDVERPVREETHRRHHRRKKASKKNWVTPLAAVAAIAVILTIAFIGANSYKSKKSATQKTLRMRTTPADEPPVLTNLIVEDADVDMTSDETFDTRRNNATKTEEKATIDLPEKKVNASKATNKAVAKRNPATNKRSSVKTANSTVKAKQQKTAMASSKKAMNMTSGKGDYQNLSSTRRSATSSAQKSKSVKDFASAEEWADYKDSQKSKKSKSVRDFDNAEDWAEYMDQRRIERLRGK